MRQRTNSCENHEFVYIHNNRVSDKLLFWLIEFWSIQDGLGSENTLELDQEFLMQLVLTKWSQTRKGLHFPFESISYHHTI